MARSPEALDRLRSFGPLVLWSFGPWFSPAFQRFRLSVPRPANPKSKIKNPPAAWDTLGMALGHPMGRLKSSMFVGLGTVVRPIYPPATRKEMQPPVQVRSFELSKRRRIACFHSCLFVSIRGCIELLWLGLAVRTDAWTDAWTFARLRNPWKH